MQPGGGAYAVEAGQQIERIALPIGKLHLDAILLVVDLGYRHTEADLHAGALDGPEQDFMQLQSRKRAKRRHPAVAHQEFVLDDQPAIWIEEIHAVIAESGLENFVEHPERVVNAERIRGLAESDAGNVEGRPPLDQHDLHAAPRERRGGGQPADAASDHQHTSNVTHDSPSVRSSNVQH